MAINTLKNLLKSKNGKFQFQEALEKMGWDTEKFEDELEIYAKTQTPKMAERIRNEYNRFMSGCGWPLELVAVDECDCIKIRVPKTKPESTVAIVTPQAEKTEQKIETPQETVPETPPQTETPQETPKIENADLEKWKQ